MEFESGIEGTLTLSVEKVRIEESFRRRSRDYKFIDGRNNFERIGDTLVLNVYFYNIKESEKQDVYDYVFKTEDDLEYITNIDEVASGDAYYEYNTNMVVEKPKTDLIFKRDIDSKYTDSFTCKMTITCDTKTTGTKP
ncbi:MAG: hypothetical protein ACRBG0_27725 [Lewinella sp.]|uniref:hypothetical protein n=1 Tax=Lewinella sp. TaxID=2004506 RepID=UPI003D6BA364